MLPTTFYPQISLNGRWSPSTPSPPCGIQSIALIILCVSLVNSSISLNSSIFTCHFFSHCSDTYSVPLSTHKHSQLLGFALFNYQPCSAMSMHSSSKTADLFWNHNFWHQYSALTRGAHRNVPGTKPKVDHSC